MSISEYCLDLLCAHQFDLSEVRLEVGLSEGCLEGLHGFSEKRLEGGLSEEHLEGFEQLCVPGCQG
jgi:hypothetical protein